jgi:uncharacterized damage-inducible protein DinB
MKQPSLAAEDVIAWNEKTSQEWRRLLVAHPDILTLPCDIAGAKVAGELLQHIVAVELRYAQQLSGLPISEYSEIPYDSAETLYATHDRATEIFRRLLNENIDWDEKFDFMTRSLGPARSTRKAVLFHSQLHSIRHYAQLSTLVRQHGIQQKWPLDYLFMHIERIEPTPVA